MSRLSFLTRKEQKIAYKRFIEAGNKDSFEGFMKQLGNSLFDLNGFPVEIAWGYPKNETVTKCNGLKIQGGLI